MYTITPDVESLRRALESWRWIGLRGATPLLVTSFADIFFAVEAEIWFLDTLEGAFKKSHDSRDDLEAALRTEHGRDHFMFAGFVDRAVSEGLVPDAGQCYDFKLHPKVGGAIEYDNIEIRNFVVALHIRGQIHEQVRHLPEGARISEFIVSNESANKPWWKVW